MEHISYSARYALIIDLIKKLQAKGSWCGETHLQKAAFIVQDLVKSKFGYKFIMYKHGPYSFDLKSELDAMKASNIIDFTFPKAGYGASIKATEFGERLYKINKQNIRGYEKACQFVADWFSSQDVKYLERVATAYFVTSKHIREPVASRAKRLNMLKPHVDIASAEEAVRIVDEKRSQAKQQALAS
jgi:hypothetical protein